jgi:hypothetical protein
MVDLIMADVARPWRRAVLIFLATGLLAALWLALNAVLPGLQQSGIQIVAARIAIHAAMLAGLWAGLARTGMDATSRSRAWVALAVPLTAWLAVVWWLAVAGAFRTPGRPVLPVAIFGPILLFVPLVLRAKTVAAIVDAMPPSWLVALQVYRLFGGVFLVAWGRGEVSGTFAIPAGSGDMLVGLLALPVAYLLHARVAGSTALAIVWNWLGIADLAIATGIGILSAPGPLQLIVPDIPNAQLGMFPTVLIPAFAVPSSIILHAISLRQLARRRRGAQPARPGAAPVGAA